ncbi:KCH and KAR9 domain-containing protein [Phanerochaete sordida]|uniref:KCH and KAR9 domain-containing protein n=1 Tax=Phanerochaete sordida TaxID=48140 RepID=A0A9P3FYA8_9APHY|nr:KCH and KAR9 domain-containing protein [Phanerochaete sordida]
MCSGGTWKREVVPDHKFDFIDTRDFTDNSFGMRMKYLWLYVIILKGFMVYISDIFTAITMLSTTSWSNAIFQSCSEHSTNGCVAIPFAIGKWLFFGCICFSFLLLAYEAYKAKRIIASRDISYAFTNVMANNYYSLRSYDHFCFFNHISNSTKRMDDFAFFVFFTFKSWKRLLLADGPRQTINALTLYAFYLSKKSKGPWWDISKYFDNKDLLTSALTASTAFTVVIFAGSVLLLIVAGVCYIPLLCHIQGNLKEYCCHKVDKRIAEIIKRKNKQRLAKAAALAKKEAAGDFSHLKNKKGELIAQPLPQPTLPNVKLDDDDDSMSIRTRTAAPSVFTGHSDFYGNGNKEYGMGYPQSDYPPMPGYDQPYGHHGDPYAQFNPSVANLALSAAPIASPERGNMVSPRPQYGYSQQGQQDLYAYGSDPHAPHRGASPGPNAAYRSASPSPNLAYNPDPAAYRGASPGPNAAYNADPHGMYRGTSPGPGVAYAYTADAGYDGGQQQYGRQQVVGGQYQQYAQPGYGYPAQHEHSGDGHDYNAGRAHAM